MKRNTPERDLHVALVKQLAIRCKPEVLWFHCPNGGSRDVVEAVNLKRMGTLPGVPDLLFIHNNSIFSVELKAKGGRLSPAQQVFQDRFMRAGGYPWVADDLDSALMFLSYSDLLR